MITSWKTARTAAVPYTVPLNRHAMYASIRLRHKVSRRSPAAEDFFPTLAPTISVLLMAKVAYVEFLFDDINNFVGDTRNGLEICKAIEKSAMGGPILNHRIS